MRVAFIADIFAVGFGSARPALLLSLEFQKERNCDVLWVSLYTDEHFREIAEEHGIEVLNLDVNLRVMPQMPVFEAWLRSLFRQGIGQKMVHPIKNYKVINSSSCIVTRADAYYAQGPMTKAFSDMHFQMRKHYEYTYLLSAPILRFLEKKMIGKLRRLSKLFIANSNFCKSMYENWNVKVDSVIPPPLDCKFFKPKPNPSSDYVLTYFAKETHFPVINHIAKHGIKIKAFGSKVPYMKYFKDDANVEFLGGVSDEELVDLYSNALFTLFTFTHEPFGYVPVESMACGTPVLTYDMQGPRETVIHNVTGWLARSDEEMVKLATKIWEQGYPSQVRKQCRERAMEFDTKKIANKWLKLLTNI